MTAIELDVALKTFLAADSVDDTPDVGDLGLITLLTGGIWTTQDTGRTGLDRLTVPSAYDLTTQKMLPNLVIHRRDFVPSTDVRTNNRWSTGGSVLELYFQTDGDDPYTTLFQARDRTFFILNNKRFPGVTKIYLVNSMDNSNRPLDQGRAAMVRADYHAVEIRRK